MAMRNHINKIGYLSGLIAFTATVVFYLIQMFQVFGWLTYPWDEILIYGFSQCITLPFIIEMLALHYVVSPDKKFWSHGALIFTTIYTVFVTANYVVQLATVIPMTVKGIDDPIQLLKQTPHSLFWDFDAIGYIFMGLAMLMAFPVFEKQGMQKWIGYSFVAHALTTPLIMFVYFYPDFSNSILLLATPWAITAPLAMLMLALYFEKVKD